MCTRFTMSTICSSSPNWSAGKPSPAFQVTSGLHSSAFSSRPARVQRIRRRETPDPIARLQSRPSRFMTTSRPFPDCVAHYDPNALPVSAAQEIVRQWAAPRGPAPSRTREPLRCARSRAGRRRDFADRRARRTTIPRWTAMRSRARRSKGAGDVEPDGRRHGARGQPFLEHAGRRAMRAHHDGRADSARLRHRRAAGTRHARRRRDSLRRERAAAGPEPPARGRRSRERPAGAARGTHRARIGSRLARVARDRGSRGAAASAGRVLFDRRRIALGRRRHWRPAASTTATATRFTRCCGG